MHPCRFSNFFLPLRLNYPLECRSVHVSFVFGSVWVLLIYFTTLSLQKSALYLLLGRFLLLILIGSSYEDLWESLLCYFFRAEIDEVSARHLNLMQTGTIEIAV